MKYKWRFTLILLLVFSMGFASPQQAQSPNFELQILYPSDTIYLDSIAQVVKQQWSSLLVDILDQGYTRAAFYQLLQSGNYDLALFSLDEIYGSTPPLYSTYSPTSFAGGELYHLDDTNYLQAGGITNHTFFDILDEYRNASTEPKKIELAKQLQHIHNDDLLFDIPIASRSLNVISWSAFDGFDEKEGIIGSLFKGAEWTSNPDERQSSDADRTTDELHYSIQNFDQIRNPLFYQTRGDAVTAKTIFSSVFLKDRNEVIHPNLGIAFNKTTTNETSTWRIHLRDDASWSDGEVLDAYDVKFTYDMLRFDWIAATNGGQLDTLLDVEVVNSTVIDFVYANNALTNKYHFTNNYIVPEHIFNQTVTIDGNEIHPYEMTSENIATSQHWSFFSANPITAGPFDYDNVTSKDESNHVFTRNLDYWYPSESDSPNGVFNLTAGTAESPYYFQFEGAPELNIETLVYHISGSQNIDENTLITSFTSGGRDIIELEFVESKASTFSSSDFRVGSLPVPGSGLVIIFNLNHAELQDIDIRRALTLATDREELVKVMGYGQQSQGTVVSSFYTDYYDETAVIGYDFDRARDIFLDKGFDALRNTDAQENFEWPWQRVPVNYLSVLISILALGTMRRLLRYDNRQLR